jgi:hypothetical protein
MEPQGHNPERSVIRRTALRVILFASIVPLLSASVSGGKAPPQKSPPKQPPSQPLGVQIISAGGEPELRVDGIPFFLHAAQFDYFRIPPNLWPVSLERYRDLGINTIDLRIPWNWHESSEGTFDFDGHTSPRRDLRGLLRLVTEMRFKLIARPGPLVGNDWRNAGLPFWLLADPSFRMGSSAIDQGAPPPAADLAARDADAAAHEWLANETYMVHAKRWMTAVAKELAPYSAKSLVSLKGSSDRAERDQENQVSGPLLFIELDGPLSVPPGSNVSNLRRYVSELRGALSDGGLSAMAFLDAPRAATQGVAPFGDGAEAIAGSTREWKTDGVGFASEWFIPAPRPAATSKPAPIWSPLSTESSPFTQSDASSLALLASALATQPDFPPLISGFAATTFAPSGEIRAIQPPLEDTLLASRILLGSGVRGITYAPLQDTLTPAGWETPAAARYFRWDAALDIAGDLKPLAASVSRNGRFLAAWGAMLASSHLRADFGIVDLRLCASENRGAESSPYAQPLGRLLHAARLAGFTPELLNPASQPVERLLRDRVIVLAVPPDKQSNGELSEQAQTSLVEFVRRGGTLVYFPTRPRGALLEPLWNGALDVPPADRNVNEWKFARGRVIASSRDFAFSNPPVEANRDTATPAGEAGFTESLAGLLDDAGATRSVRRANNDPLDTNLVLTQLVSNVPSASSERPQSCVASTLCAEALVAVTNLSPDEPAVESFEFLDPREPGDAAAPVEIPLNVTVPAHDSVFLPLHAPLCSTAAPGDRCGDEVVASGTELLGAVRDGKTLELTFYAPARATVRLHLDGAPLKIELDGDIRPESQWKPETGDLEVTLLRGAAPSYRRLLRIQMKYVPRVPEKQDPAKLPPGGMEYRVFNAMRVPLGDGLAIPTAPPLIPIEASSTGRLLLGAWNHSEKTRPVDFDVEGAFHGSAFAKVYGGDQEFARMRIESTQRDRSEKPAALADGLLHSALVIRSGQDRTTSSIYFQPANESGNLHYQFDYDLDGAPEWTLESNRLCLIVSPAEGGRAFALIDKSGNDDLITLDGAFHDFLAPSDTPLQNARESEDFSLNRAYRAEWVEGQPDAGLRLVFPGEETAGGLRVEKTLRLPEPETVEATYRVSQFAASSAADPANGPSALQSFISMLSVPLPDPDEGNARICWQESSGSSDEPSFTSSKSQTDPDCEDLVPSGRAISVADPISRMEILSPGRHPLTVEWSAGRVIVVPKLFSVQVNFVVPSPLPGAAPAEFTLRYSVPGSRK